MIFFLVSVGLLGFVWWLIRQNKEIHSCGIFGDCGRKCEWCRILGFTSDFIDGMREYVMCKWCGKFQNKGQEVQQCYHEICPKCWPNYKKLENRINPKQITKELGDRSKNTKKKLFLTWTGSPGHLCIVCQTKMVVFSPNWNPLQKLKDELYKFHEYNDSR